MSLFTRTCPKCDEIASIHSWGAEMIFKCTNPECGLEFKDDDEQLRFYCPEDGCNGELQEHNDITLEADNQGDLYSNSKVMKCSKCGQLVGILWTWTGVCTRSG